MTITKCPECGGKVAERSNVVRAQPLGRSVRYSERRLVCENCGSTYLNDELAKANDTAWSEAFGPALATVSGEDLRLMREASKLTRPELEAILGLGTNTLARWEDGTRPIPPYIATMLRMIALHPISLRELQKLVSRGYVKREAAEVKNRDVVSSVTGRRNGVFVVKERDGRFQTYGKKTPHVRGDAVAKKVTTKS